jgi:hypothetical protein
MSVWVRANEPGPVRRVKYSVYYGSMRRDYDYRSGFRRSSSSSMRRNIPMRSSITFLLTGNAVHTIETLFHRNVSATTLPAATQDCVSIVHTSLVASQITSSTFSSSNKLLLDVALSATTAALNSSHSKGHSCRQLSSFIRLGWRTREIESVEFNIKLTIKEQ